MYEGELKKVYDEGFKEGNRVGIEASIMAVNNTIKPVERNRTIDRIVQKIKNEWEMQELYLPIHFIQFIEEMKDENVTDTTMELMRKRIDEAQEEMCDNYCQYPSICNEEELMEKCEVCPLNRLGE